MQHLKPSSWMNDDHVAYQDAVRQFLQAEVMPNKERWTEQGFVEREFWLKAGEAGLLGATIPEEYGGSGAARSFDAVTFLEQGRAGDSGWGFGVHNIVTHYLLAYGTEAQKKRWLPGLANGEFVGAIAMTEPGTGSDLQSVRTRAELDGDHYVIDGAKTFITNGQTANLICVVAKTDSDAKASGISLIMVETDEAEGFKRGRNLNKVGMKRQDTSELFFEGVRVPRENLLGPKEGQGFYQLMNQLVWERLLVGVSALGACDLALAETLAYVTERKVFGKRVFELQNTRFKLAEATTKTEVLRAFIDQCVTEFDAGTLTTAKASMAKYWGSEVQCEVIDECLQLHGGYGYMMDYTIGELYADARVQKIYAGTNEIMKELIARSLVE
jgi:acyl-CoA dehydrogenase